MRSAIFLLLLPLSCVSENRDSLFDLQNPAAPMATRIDSGPTGAYTGENAAFTFSCTVEQCAFTCQFDDGTPESCTSPQVFSNLALGEHTFSVQATAGKARDDSSEKRTWRTVEPMKDIPRGCFAMGDSFDEGSENERPVHNVCINAYKLDTVEVTNEQFKSCVDANACPDHPSASPTRASYFDNPAFSNFPAIEVTWEMAAAYCQWAGKRLPTEAEFEYAARGGLESKRYSFGNTISCADTNYGRGDSSFPCWNFGGLDNDTQPVGSYPANKFGLYDMLGNVSEWVNDYFDKTYYLNRPSPDENPQGPTTATSLGHIGRGGAWSYKATFQRVAYREGAFLGYNRGFRCAQ